MCGTSISVVAHLSFQMVCAIILLEKKKRKEKKHLHTFQPTPKSLHGKKSIENSIYEKEP